jgi:DNA ligase (NAD+)
MGKKSADKLMANIEKSKTRPQPNLIYALGIRHIGVRMAEILVEHFSGLKNLMNATLEDLDKIEGVGPSIAESIVQFFHDKENRRIINRLADLGVNIEGSAEKEQEKLPQTLAGKTFVITGTLSMERGELERMIKARGGKPTSSVSKKTDYLVLGENPGSKLQKAEELGITIIDEDQLKALLGNAD